MLTRETPEPIIVEREDVRSYTVRSSSSPSPVDRQPHRQQTHGDLCRRGFRATPLR
jgi:hypothetical protein